MPIHPSAVKLIEPTYRITGRMVYALRADAVDILFDDIVTAHHWAETRGLEAWTVTEQQVWTAKS